MSLLAMEKVTVRFGGLVAVSELNLTVEPGEVVGLIGPNGAGKTTAFNAVTGLVPVSDGRVRFDGRDLGRLKPHQRTQLGLARTFQNIRLFGDQPALTNVLVGCHSGLRSGLVASLLRTPAQRREERAAAARALALLEFAGLSEVADVDAGSLPYGLQRRLEIARALATEPKLLLLDEPAAGMNESESQDLLRLVGKIRELGIAVLLIEHDMHVVMSVCDRLAVLNFGKRIALGTPDAVRENPDVVVAYLGQEVG
ncbi:MAG: transporter [Firmicutes bacterium]|nr:transporter [Bacillota bacterium]